MNSFVNVIIGSILICLIPTSLTNGANNLGDVNDPSDKSRVQPGVNRQGKFIGDSNSDEAFNYLYRDGSYQYGYSNRDYGASYHFSEANSRNVVRGRFGSRNPQTRKIDETIYTAGPRGYRPRGANIHRRFDLNQNRPGPIGSPDDPYFDPYEDPSYHFGFRTRTYNRQETANRNKDVSGRYSYLDDVGVRHDVEYIAGKNIGFHVKTPFPDTGINPYGPLYRGSPRERGHTSIQQGLDGSYRFIAAGPDQRRSESKDALGNVRGSYSYLDNRGKKHVVNYIAGPGIGYKVLKSPKDIPAVFPLAKNNFSPPSAAELGFDAFDAFNTDFPTAMIDDLFNGADDDLFNTAASGHVKPNRKNEGNRGGQGNRGSGVNRGQGFGLDYDDYGNKIESNSLDAAGSNGGQNGGDDDYDLFNKGTSKGNHGNGNDDKNVDNKKNDSGNKIDSKVTANGGDKSNNSNPSNNNSYGVGNYGNAYHYGTNNRWDQEDNANKNSQSGSLGNENNGKFATILRNVGDRPIHLPPGVPVKGHVQAIDILPYGSRLPSPSVQMNKDRRN